ncbi:MAG TPA: condensation domain-containing protein [Pyrinomonadaceae bacterium]|jgi:acyl carrier protein
MAQNLRSKSELFYRIATELSDAEQLLTLVESQHRQPRPALGKEFIAPRTPLEETLAEIWAQLLGVERVGIQDNFFALGGHSLLAIQLISRVRVAFSVDLPLRRLFEAPTLAGMAEIIETTSITGQGLDAPPIVPIPRDAPELPLSFAEQRLWFLDQYEPGSATYNESAVVRLKGRFNLEAMERAITEIARRHETLRTTFETVDGMPVRVIAPASSLSLAVDDLRALPAGEREAESERLATLEAQRPFDLARGPLLRFNLLRLGEEDHVVVLTMHHIISDWWSVGVFLREVAALYEAFSGGRPSPLPELPVQYADYAAWQRDWLQSDALKSQLSYWQRQLGGSLPVLDLPTDRPRPAIQTFRGATQTFTLPLSLSGDLKALGLDQRVTLFMLLLAALQTLLYRYTGQTDISVGSSIAGRSREETEGLIGFFLNTLVMRTDLSGNPRFQELLDRVREVTLGAYANQDVPIEMVLEALQPERHLGHNPLFQVLFIFQNNPMPDVELPGLASSGLGLIDKGTAMFDLTMRMEDTERGLVGTLEYNTDLFDQSTMERMLKHYERLLEGIVEDSRQRIGDLPLLTAEEERRLLDEWSSTGADYSLDASIPDLFEEQVRKTPDKAAAILNGNPITFRELNEQADALARLICSLK